MPASSDSRRAEVEGELAARFGVPSSTFADAEFSETQDGEIWISAATAPGLRARRSPGLRAFRRTPLGLKPTSAFLVSLGPKVTTSRIALDEKALRDLLLGRRIPWSHSDGYVALAHDGDVLGCGLVADGVVHSLIPTGRRRELLDILDAPPRANPPEV